MTSRLRGALAGTTLLLLVALAPSAHADAETFVTSLGGEVVATLQESDISKAEKLTKLQGLLDEVTDLELLAKLVLGRYWRTATPEERDAYVTVFRELANKTMADRLGDYGGETIEVIGSQQLNERDTMVQTLIHRPSGAPPYNVDWRVRESKDRTAVIDVVAEGVSLVVTQRSEVGEIVANKGMPGLIDTLNGRLEAKNNPQ